MARYLVPGILLILFLYMAGFNTLSMWKRTIRKQRFPSIVPLVPGVLGFFALLSWPGIHMQIKARYFWLPFLLDVGCVPYLVVCLATIGHHSLRVNRFVRLATFEACDGDDPQVTLVLYKTGAFTLRRETPKPSWSVLHAGGDWSRHGEDVLLHSGHTDIRYAIGAQDRVMMLLWCSDSGSSILNDTDLQLTAGHLE